MAAEHPSERAAAAAARAHARNAADGRLLRPFTSVALAIVVVSAVDAHPRPGLHGRGAGVLASLAVYALAAAPLVIRGRRGGYVVLLAGLSAGAIGLAAFQGTGAGVTAACVPVLAMTRWLGQRTGLRAAGALIVVVAGADATHAGTSFGEVAADVLLCALMAVVGTLMQRSRDGEDRMALLYVELQDARDAQARSAALAERGRIAGELHDVLAHSLSGAAIQLQGARRLLARSEVDEQAAAAVDRAAELVRDGLADARRAVGALRGDALPTVDELPALVAALREDLDVEVELSVSGTPSGELSPEAGLALYRGAQEAITNVARYAPGAAARVAVIHEPRRTRLEVVDGGADRDAEPAPAHGGGHGLDAMRERVARAGGSCSAGPDGDGWRVALEVPA